MRLFDRFDKVYCVNLERRPDRMQHFKDQVIKYDLGEYQRFDAIDGKKLNMSDYNTNLNCGELGVILSNIEILRDAISNNYETIVVVEDDCLFLEDVKKIGHYFNYLPKDWDLLYLGGNHNLHIGVDKPIKINKFFVKLQHTYSAHFIVIKNKLFQVILEKLIKLEKQLDVVYADLQKEYNAICLSPGIVKQLSNFSDIQNKEIDYNWLIN
jgi:hypothetical protein